MIEFFDRKGLPAAFCHDGHSLYLWTGRAAAFITAETVFSYAGRYIGWLEDGWLRDEEGRCLLFESDAIRGPAKPVRGARTPPGTRGIRPARAEPQATPPRPASSDAWSGHSFADLI